MVPRNKLSRTIKTVILAGITVFLSGHLPPCGLTVSAVSAGNKNDQMITSSLEESGKYLIRNVLFINSYHPGYRWSDQVYEGIRKGLEPVFGRTLDLRVEYLDAKRYGPYLNGSMGGTITALWEKKYSGI